MFNTLTVSLLERTREVGLMKAMGLKSGEVKSLFLTESMIVGLYGGILGLLLGIGFGKLLSLILSALSVVKGVGFVDVSYVPISFVVFVIFLSILVGIATGYTRQKELLKSPI
jgi:putative ABC transport system permease protein